MLAVTKDEFFEEILPRDIVLRVEPDAVFWETRNRIIVGKTTPGWRGGMAKEYFLRTR